jgi:type VI secretion system secreted protein Hcp
MPIYLQLDGIQGDATQASHKQWTDIKSIQWSVNRTMNTLAGASANREGSEPEVGEVILTKTSDSSSPKLLTEAASGSAGKTAKIHLVTSGSPGDTYLEFTLTNVLVSGYTITSTGDRPEENLVLNFTKVEMKYTPFDASHTAQSPIISSYDLSTTKAA